MSSKSLSLVGLLTSCAHFVTTALTIRLLASLLRPWSVYHPILHMHLVRPPSSAPSTERTGEVINRQSPHIYIVRASLAAQGANGLTLFQP